MAVTSRRAGKTTACALHLLHTAITYPKSVCLYIAPARVGAKKIIWPTLHEMAREHNIESLFNESDLAVKFPNGSVIYISGAATSVEINRFRGLALKLTYVDEAQDFGNYLEQLIDDVLVPASFDNKGQIRLIGTPGPVPVGYYYDAYNSSGWSHHGWTIFDNPWIERKRGESAQRILEQEIERRGVTESDPTIQREIFGRFVVDQTKLVIDYDPARNHFDILPPGDYKHILGIDIGFEDADAIAVIAYADTSSTTYLVDEFIATKQGLTDLVIQIQRVTEKYKPHKMLIDEGGLGKKLAEEIRRRHRIPVHPAEKQRKFENIEILNDCLRTKRFMARRDSRFANDSRLVEWDFEKITPDKKAISNRFHSDIIDAVLYGFKASPAYSWEAPPVLPTVGTPEWGKAEEKKMYEEALAHFQKEEIQSDMEWL